MKELFIEQQDALERLIKFVGDPARKVFVFGGFAGTGKTFTMEAFGRYCMERGITLRFTATTNKAAKVLAANTGDATTVHSFLGLKPSKHEGKLVFSAGKKGGDGILVVDEASMVDSELYDRVMLYGGKIIFLIDGAQLPPVNEEMTKVLENHRPDVMLRTVRRHDNQILAIVTKVREAWENGRIGDLHFATDMGDDSGVFVHRDYSAFARHIGKAAKAGAFSSDGCRVIAWRNKTVDKYNQIIRDMLYDCPEQAFVDGELIVTASAIRREEDGKEKTILNTATELVVISSSEYTTKASDNFVRTTDEFRSVSLRVREPVYGLEYLLKVLDPRDKTKFDRMLDLLRREKRRYELHRAQEIFDDIKYAYALTAHRSQGSTYRTVWVDTDDILSNIREKEALQCLYVAMSRPTNYLHIL